MNEGLNKFLPLIKKLVVIAVLLSIAVFLFKIAPYYKPTEEFENDVVRVIIDDKDVTNELPDNVFMENNVVMMSSKTAMKYFDSIFVYFDEGYNTAIITNDKTVAKVKLGENVININGEIKSLNGTATMSGDKLYIPISSLEDITNVQIEFNEKVIATTVEGSSRMNKVIVDSEHKLKAYKKVFSMANGIATEGEELFIFDINEKSGEEYVKARNIRGDIGYIQLDSLDTKETIIDNKVITNEVEVDNKKYSLVWEYAENYSPDRSNESKINAVDIISPTWLYLKNAEADLKVTTDQDYFKWAKNQNYEIWPTLKNDFTTLDELSTVMNDMELRSKFINSVVEYAVENQFDGINIDFENMYKEDKDVFSEFVRELSAHLRRNDIIVSIDVTIPGGSDTYSLCYDRKALSKAVDYMMLMAYDQYGVWSTTAGPVASLSWVERNINDMLGYEGVDNDKLFLCVPFYSRYWTENSETGKVKYTKAIDMKNANSYLERYKDIAVWNEADGQYYIEFSSNSTTTKIWIENEDALKKKIELINKYDLAGVAVWRWGYEDDDTWQVIEETMNIQ